MDFVPEGSMWLLYLGLFLAPFVQEDSAVIGAASLSLSESNHWITIFGTILAGLIASDSWKYWLGWAAKHHKWAKKYAQKDRVIKMKKSVLENSFKTLVVVRFLPMARIPTYLATGFFGVKYYKYWCSIAFSALLYVSAFFLTFHLLGEIVGKNLKTYLPLVALGIVGAVGLFFVAKLVWQKAKNRQTID
jgi:membrane protein DedA with SNARE-associated domain